jgi:hypothetical protein
MLEREWVDMGDWPAEVYDDTEAGVRAGVSIALLGGMLESEPSPGVETEPECCMLGGLSLLRYWLPKPG